MTKFQFKEILPLKEGKKILDLFAEDFAIQVENKPRKSEAKPLAYKKLRGLNMVKTGKKSKQPLTNSELYAKLNPPNIENIFFRILKKDIKKFFSIHKMNVKLNSLSSMFRDAFLLSMKSKVKKDKKTPSGVRTGQLLMSFKALYKGKKK